MDWIDMVQDRALSYMIISFLFPRNARNIVTEETVDSSRRTVLHGLK